MNAISFTRIVALKTSCLMLLVASVASAVEPGTSGSQSSAAPSDPLSAYAAMGSSFAQSNHLDQLGWDEAQTTAFLDGMRAALQGKPFPFDAAAAQVTAETGRRLQALVARGSQPTVPAAIPASSGRLEAFMKEAQKRLGLQRADNGLAYRVEVGRGGPRPRLIDTVLFSCVATAADGKTNLPVLSAEQATVEMSKLLPGFQQVLQMMTVGSVAVFVLPPALSFGEGEWPAGVERGSPLIFQLTLHEVVSAGAN